MGLDSEGDLGTDPVIASPVKLRLPYKPSPDNDLIKSNENSRPTPPNSTVIIPDTQELDNGSGREQEQLEPSHNSVDLVSDSEKRDPSFTPTPVPANSFRTPRATRFLFGKRSPGTRSSPRERKRLAASVGTSARKAVSSRAVRLRSGHIINPMFSDSDSLFDQQRSAAKNNNHSPDDSKCTSAITEIDTPAPQLPSANRNSQRRKSPPPTPPTRAEFHNDEAFDRTKAAQHNIHGDLIALKRKIACPKCRQRGTLSPDGYRKDGVLVAKCRYTPCKRTTSGNPLRRAIANARTLPRNLATTARSPPDAQAVKPNEMLYREATRPRGVHGTHS